MAALYYGAKSNMRIRGADFVMFLVSDLAKAVTFFREILGLSCEIESLEYQWAEFNCGNITLSLKGKGLAPGAGGEGRIALSVADMVAASEELREKGVRLESQPTDNGCCWHLEVRDPDGNRVILHQRADGSYGQGTSATSSNL